MEVWRKALVVKYNAVYLLCKGGAAINGYNPLIVVGRIFAKLTVALTYTVDYAMTPGGAIVSANYGFALVIKNSATGGSHTVYPPCP